MSAPTTEQLLTVERARNADLESSNARLRQALHEVQAAAADELLRLRAQLKAARAEIARKEVYIQQLHRKLQPTTAQEA